MMAQIREIKTRALEIHGSVVEVAEDILRRAKSGEIVALSAAMVLSDGCTDTAESATDRAHYLLAAIAHLFHSHLHRET